MTGRRTIAQTSGDVTGDGIPDRVWLTGYQEADSSAWQSIQLRVQDGASYRETRLSLPEDAGYHPRVTLCPLTRPGRLDILISLDSGGSGGIGYYTVYSWMNRGFRRIFETAAYNAAYQYDITYEPGRTVLISSRANGNRYRLSLVGRDPAVLQELYAPDGSLLMPGSGFADPLGLLLPVDPDGEGVFALLAGQGISGLFHADRLGEMFNLLRWQGTRFALKEQLLGLSPLPVQVREG